MSSPRETTNSERANEIVCVCVCVLAHACAWGGQKWPWVVFLTNPLPYFLRQGCSLNLTSCLASRKAPGTLLPSPSGAEITGTCCNACFSCGCWGSELRFSCLHGRCSNPWAIFPGPLARGISAFCACGPKASFLHPILFRVADWLPKALSAVLSYPSCPLQAWQRATERTRSRWRGEKQRSG